MKIYLAGPISGKSYSEVVDLYKDKSAILRSMGYKVLCPMTGKTHLRNELEFRAHGLDSHPVSTNHAIFERDKWMVSTADLILADLSNSEDRVSIGTMMELAWASMLGKHSIVVMPEKNVHRHAFVLEAADLVFTNIFQAYGYLEELAKGV
jgi:nucleoside 2-deoxyribosyltransferase